MRGIEHDIEEGADYVMVKPGIFYLDIIKEVATKYSHIPIAVYQVSGIKLSIIKSFLIKNHFKFVCFQKHFHR